MTFSVDHGEMLFKTPSVLYTPLTLICRYVMKQSLAVVYFKWYNASRDFSHSFSWFSQMWADHVPVCKSKIELMNVCIGAIDRSTLLHKSYISSTL